MLPPGYSDGATYLPGQVLSGRYRMIGMLGRGGMGEVYRADDLKLGQPVALKFLSPGLEQDPERLEAFLSEVRLSLRVSHPNVCRAYDIGEIDGRHFLSMEYVDGEDLASLLRRIGRLPEDKATEIARQICAGLAAAHNAGVLHRDLKPANIMLDGRGRAKITDFGLASATAGISGREAQSGTPQYMAPEQFDGAELTVRTDLYSLGLVLYELFTGKPAFAGRNVLELAAMRSTTPTSPSSHVSALDPAVERAILRCLAPDPAQRPSSAEQLAAMLPGGDPLAMALAAGETPSPDLVAQAGGRGELRPWIAASLLTAVLAGLALVWYSGGSFRGVHDRIPLPKTPDELRFAAQSALTAAGYATRSGNPASGFAFDSTYFREREMDDSSMARWDSLPAVYPVPMSYWYRESPRPMQLAWNVGAITQNHPAHSDPGMLRVRLDPSARLQELSAVPAQLGGSPGPWTEPDWAPMFTAAGLVSSEWAPVASAWPSEQAADVRRAWTKGSTRIEAASFRGQITWFRIVAPWEHLAAVTKVSPTFGGRLLAWLPLVLIAGVQGAAAVLARRNLRRDRADLRGALRLAAVFVSAASILEFARLANSPARVGGVLMNNIALHVFTGLVLVLFYLAAEPFVRRWWPDSVISWNRVLDGRLRDPLVGRHLLIGALAGLCLTLLDVLRFSLSPPASVQLVGVLTSSMSWSSDRAYVGALFDIIAGSVGPAMLMLMLTLILRVLLRRQWLVYVGLLLLAWWTAGGDATWLAVLAGFASYAIPITVVTRYGLVATMASFLFFWWEKLSLTTNADSWFFHHSVITMALFGGLAVYAAWASLGNQKLFRESVLS
jgi:hypothetical protein